MSADAMGSSAVRRPAVFLDRDGTITRYVEYCRRPEDLRLLPGAAAAIRRLNDAGRLVVVVTNQSAIGRGWLTVEQLDAIHAKLHRRLRRFGARVDAIYYCPHHPDDGCVCRKPRPGMVLRAARELNVDLSTSFTVGDRLFDVASGQAAGVRSVLLRCGHPAESIDGIVPDHEAPDLAAAVDWILGTRVSDAVRPHPLARATSR